MDLIFGNWEMAFLARFIIMLPFFKSTFEIKDCFI